MKPVSAAFAVTATGNYTASTRSLTLKTYTSLFCIVIGPLYIIVFVIILLAEIILYFMFSFKFSIVSYNYSFMYAIDKASRLHSLSFPM